jgi:hypothetical protein
VKHPKQKQIQNKFKTNSNKTENLFSPYPRSESEYQLVHKAQNRNVLLLAGKACNKLPAYGRKKACNPAGLRPVIKTVIFLQGCRARVQYVQFGDLPLQLIAERALFISMAKFARSLVTCHCSLVSCHCSLVSCHCSLVSCHCSLVSCHCSLVSATAIWYLPLQFGILSLQFGILPLILGQKPSGISRRSKSRYQKADKTKSRYDKKPI